MEDRKAETMLGASAALAWSARSGLLTSLIAGPRREADLVEHLSCDARALSLVLGVLEASGWTRREGDRHALASTEGHDMLGHELWLWRQLDAFAQTGVALIPESAREAIYPHVVSHLGTRFARDAETLASALEHEPGAILDVGAGSGIWSLAIAARDRASSVTALDLPSTIEVFRRHAEHASMNARIETIAGDYHTVALPERRFSLVILANVVHLETPDRAASLVARSARALAPGGALVIVDAIGDPPPEHALTVAVYALHLGMRVPGSRVYTRSELEGLARGAELGSHRWIPLSRGLAALVARGS